MTRRGGLIALAAFAGGALAGVAAEELLVRRLFARDDPSAGERFGVLPAESVLVRSFDGTELYARVSGPKDSPACVLVHGFTLSHQIWHYQVRDLTADGRFRVVAYDARGHGRSGPARGPAGRTRFDGETLARDLHAVMHATNATPAVVVGHSLGGMSIQSLLEFKDEFPEEFGSSLRGIVLVNTTFTAALGTWGGQGTGFRAVRRRMQRVAERLAGRPDWIERLRLPASDLAMLFTRVGFGGNASRAQVALTRRLIESVPVATLAAAIDLASFDSHQSLEKIEVPVVVCAGTRDLLTPPWLAKEMTERIPTAALVEFPDAGHMVMLEQHERFGRVLVRFLEEVLP